MDIHSVPSEVSPEKRSSSRGLYSSPHSKYAIFLLLVGRLLTEQSEINPLYKI